MDAQPRCACRPRESCDNGDVVTRIRLIRHASTEPGGRLCGSFDLPLSRAGRLELDARVRRLSARGAPDALVTSTLRRASDVAEALAHAWSLQPSPAPWAREIHCGEVEGMALDVLQRRFPDVWARNQAQRDDDFGWPGGETYAEFRARVLEGLRSVAAAHRGRRVVVVTHAGVISQVLGVIRGRSPAVWEADRPDPLTATDIAWAEHRPGDILSYNDRDWC